MTTESWRQTTEKMDPTSIAIEDAFSPFHQDKSAGPVQAKSLRRSVGSNAAGFRHPSLPMRKPRRETNQTLAATRLHPHQVSSIGQFTRVALGGRQAIIVGWRWAYH